MRRILASLLLTSILAVGVSAGQSDTPPGQIDVPPSPDAGQQGSSTSGLSGLLLYLLGISWSG
ncbi:MAG TPA: hypothetical protein VG148_04205 [Pyrinomonadaceae bacterium]|nr:hypothetical protein [Pyrinomonadaceae bacterium]